MASDSGVSAPFAMVVPMLLGALAITGIFRSIASPQKINGDAVRSAVVRSSINGGGGRMSSFVSQHMLNITSLKQPKNCPREMKRKAATMAQQSSLAMSQPYSAGPSFAIALIALGDVTAKSVHVVERCVQSIRRRGLYFGTIVIVTDAKRSRFKSLMVDYSNIYIINVESRPNGTLSKRYKTELLDLLDGNKGLDDVELLLYMDVDIVIAEPLQSFIHYVQSMATILDQPSNRNQPSYMLMCEEQGQHPSASLATQYIMAASSDSTDPNLGHVF